MRPLTRCLLVAVLLIGCVGCDQLTKGLARENLDRGVVSSYAHDTFRLVYAENPGAFLSLGATLSPRVRTVVFQAGVGLVTCGFILAALLWRGLGRRQITALTLLAASGLGNLLDRLLHDGRVTDFLNLGLGPLRTGIFNVADMVGVAGAILLVASYGAAGRPAPR